MSNGNAFDRFSKLVFKIGMMVVDGKRKAEEVADWLQVVIEREDFLTLLASPRPAQSVPPSTTKVTDPFAVSNWRADWQKFYRKVFGLRVDFSQVVIKDDPGGFGWALFVPKGLTLNQAWAKCRERFPSSSDYGDDHDSAVPTNERTAVESYGRRFRSRVEADEENKNFSANKLAECGGENVTLMERFLMELWYHWKTGKHLDIQYITLCAGSRDHFGFVPRAGWHFGKFQVWYYSPNDYYVFLRTRSAV